MKCAMLSFDELFTLRDKFGSDASQEISEELTVAIQTKILNYLKRRFDGDYGWVGKWSYCEEFVHARHVFIYVHDQTILSSLFFEALISSIPTDHKDWGVLFEIDPDKSGVSVHGLACGDTVYLCENEATMRILKTLGPLAEM